MIRFLILTSLLAIFNQRACAGIPNADQALRKGDWKTVLSILTPLANQGNAEAQNFLGTLYETGEAVTHDDKLALEWYSKSAQNGFAKAQANLGFLYEKGKGVSQDANLAKLWITKAAEQNLGIAQQSLGFYYSIGFGVQQDYAQAFKWYSLAAQQNLAGAEYNLGIIYQNGLGVTKDLNLALFWYQKSADQGFQKAIEALKHMENAPFHPPINEALESDAELELTSLQNKKRSDFEQIRRQCLACMKQEIRASLNNNDTDSTDIALNAAKSCGEPLARHFVAVLNQSQSRANAYLLSLAFQQLTNMTQRVQ
jgi:TPR repeat protein